MTTATKEQLVVAAQTMLNKSIAFLELACQDDPNAEAYVIDHLKIIASENHGFLSRDLNLDQLIDRYREDVEEIDIPDDFEEIFGQIQNWD